MKHSQGKQNSARNQECKPDFHAPFVIVFVTTAGALEESTRATAAQGVDPTVARAAIGTKGPQFGGAIVAYLQIDGVQVLALGA
jgi:hypothetical protein